MSDAAEHLEFCYWQERRAQEDRVRMLTELRETLACLREHKKGDGAYLCRFGEEHRIETRVKDLTDLLFPVPAEETAALDLELKKIRTGGIGGSYDRARELAGLPPLPEETSPPRPLPCTCTTYCQHRGYPDAPLAHGYFCRELCAKQTSVKP